MRRAAKVDANQAEVVAALRQAGAGVTLLHQVGGGCPDLLVGIHGCWGVIEVKDGAKPPSARKRTPAQIRWWDENIHGGPRAIVTDVEGALRFLQLLNPYIEQGGT